VRLLLGMSRDESEDCFIQALDLARKQKAKSFELRAAISHSSSRIMLDIAQDPHSETLAAQRPPQPEPIYYCATGVEFPAFEPCKDMKGQRDI
jgi:hypothetical protein